MPFCRHCGAEHPAEAKFCPVCGRPTGGQPQPGAGGAAWPAEYPVLLAIDNPPRHSRLTALFRLFLLIPHAIVIAFYAFAAGVVAVVAWFAIMFTGRYPRGMFDFQVGYLRYATRFSCFAYMLTSGFPPFGPGSNDDGYPVRLSVIYPERLSRLKTFFRLILAIPGYFIQEALSILASVLAVVAWF